MWISGIPLRIFLGYWGDRVPKTLIVSGGVFFGAASLLVLQSAQELWHLMAFASLFAVMQGTIPLNWVMIGDYFGRKNYATLRGFMSIAYTGGTMGMPVFAGAMFDTTQSYELVVWIMIALYLLAGVWFAFLRAPAPPKLVPVEAVRAG
jgi:MFS family permease